MRVDSESRAIVYGLLTVMLWSTVASAFNLALRYVSPFELLLYSSLPIATCWPLWGQNSFPRSIPWIM